MSGLRGKWQEVTGNEVSVSEPVAALHLFLSNLFLKRLDGDFAMRVLAPIAAILIITGCSDGAGNLLSGSSPEGIATHFVESLITGDLNEGRKLVLPKTLLETLMVAMSNDLQKIKPLTFSTKPCVNKTRTDNGEKYFYCEGMLSSNGAPIKELEIFLQEDGIGKLKAVAVKANKVKSES